MRESQMIGMSEMNDMVSWKAGGENGRVFVFCMLDPCHLCSLRTKAGFVSL